VLLVSLARRVLVPRVPLAQLELQGFLDNLELLGQVERLAPLEHKDLVYLELKVSLVFLETLAPLATPALQDSLDPMASRDSLGSKDSKALLESWGTPEGLALEARVILV
jgi:hypothetical protein